MIRKLLAIALIGGACAAPSHATTHHAFPLPQTMNRPCPEEDSTNCYWDAGSAGNGLGHSFIVREFPGKADMICVMYAEKTFAAHHDYCQAMHLPPANCNSIDGHEFPHKAAWAFRVCNENENHGARPHYIGEYDGRHGIFEIVGPTTIYVNRNGFFETS